MREKARYKKEIIEKKRANNEGFFTMLGVTGVTGVTAKTLNLNFFFYKFEN